MDNLKRKSAHSQVDAIVASQTPVKGVPVISRKIEGVDAAVLRELAEQTVAKMTSGVVVLAIASEGKVALVGPSPRTCRKSCMPATSSRR